MKRNIVIATVAAAALIAGGTATAIAVSGDDEAPVKRSGVQVSDDDKNDTDDNNDSADDETEDATEAKAAEITAADAINAALKHKSGTAVSADLDDEGTNLVWDVDILTNGGAWHSVQVDPGTGKVLGSHADRDDDGDDGDDAAETEQIRAALKGSSVTAAEAAEAAAGKGTITSVDLDEDSKNKAWEIDTTATDGTGSDWRVTLDTAKVTADRTDD
ncbi:PepSY domain-containing protein [Streptomyces tailanensis]|uniref:PepSY domain-containing protein n=1 Tax=Streptomyces tailanensis TaxID=2569858 RepID=UPI00122DDFE5|nr:PepSY domain-containing protein [Streptomyces tailanensis]